PLGGLVPARDEAAQGLADDGVVGRFDDGGQAVRRLGAAGIDEISVCWWKVHLSGGEGRPSGPRRARSAAAGLARDGSLGAPSRARAHLSPTGRLVATANPRTTFARPPRAGRRRGPPL